MPYADPEASREHSRRYYASHREAIIKRTRAWRKANPKRSRAFQSAWAKRNRKKINATQQTRRERTDHQRDKEWYAKTIKKQMLKGAVARARKRGVPFDLKPEDILLPTHCPALGVELNYGVGKGQPQSNSPSLDRIVPALGYVPGNVLVVSYRYNTLKGNATPEELRRVAQFAALAITYARMFA